ncbi:MAG TPA: endonuclease/exonuclease/phosphatase family protein [Pyrinomonadaceae bacterium]|nr:endonuclease/exonuclease/phosphatase family protein [Pyrinomonadaceae bacterium]
MSYNIRFGGIGREERIAEAIRYCRPDIVVLQEATKPEVVARLADLSDMPYWSAKRGNSVAFVSRLPISHHEWHHHPHLQRAFLEMELDGIRIYGVHLRATHSNYTERGRMREVRALLAALEAKKNEFHVLTGDFNTLAPGELLNMQKLPMRYRILAVILGGRIEFRAIQMMIEAGYTDSFRRLHTEPGFTFPAWDPHVRLDYVFTPKQFSERVSSCEVVTDFSEPAKATDHLPLLAGISLD